MKKPTNKKKPQKKKPKGPFKHFFVQDIGCFSDQFFVSIGLTPKEFGQKLKSSKTIKKIIRDDADEIAGMLLPNDAFVQVFKEADKPGSEFTVLFMKEWKRSLTDTAELVHELMHVIQFLLLESRGMEKEHEGPAYAMEYLYLEIVRKLDKKWYSEGRR